MTFLRAKVYFSETIREFHNLIPKMRGRSRSHRGGGVSLQQQDPNFQLYYILLILFAKRLQSGFFYTSPNNFSEETTECELLTRIVPAFQALCFQSGNDDLKSYVFLFLECVHH